jgi:hypothetical protein
MNFFKFYRLDFCIRNLGISVIAIASLGFMPNPFYIVLTLLQLLLIQMNSFSMNNYFDYKIWKEGNYIGRLLKSGFNEKLLVFLTFMPLLILCFTIPFSNGYMWILFAYIILFILYHAPNFRLKNSWILSIIINSICSGLILYIYPYMFLSNGLNLTGIVFSTIFFFYMAFHEVIHQIAHLKKDKIYSLPQSIGIKNTINVARIFLFIPMILALIPLIVDPIRYFFFSGTLIFCSIRLYKLSHVKPRVQEFQKIRGSFDKFYSFQEAIYYLVFLYIPYII